MKNLLILVLTFVHSEHVWDDKTHTQHIELHVKRNLDNKNIIGVKF